MTMHRTISNRRVPWLPDRQIDQEAEVLLAHAARRIRQAKAAITPGNVLFMRKTPPSE